jgi:hypothetical protein
VKTPSENPTSPSLQQVTGGTPPSHPLRVGLIIEEQLMIAARLFHGWNA